ncbi:hypothetical protein CRG98_000604 [Punica granatum]|uniref:Uncharacterized protein n=1 Tax=Punica granatum TaxID=22663 RepID=A0A2I0LE48_PUNGR|nr:hypothetical protein CRG98_000604 [Punica granatum]
MATTSGGQLGVGSHRPCIKIPSGATMVYTGQPESLFFEQPPWSPPEVTQVRIQKIFLDHVRTRISSRRGTRARTYATRLGSVHLPGDARWTHVRRGRHLSFYDPKVEGWQVTRV